MSGVQRLREEAEVVPGASRSEHYLRSLRSTGEQKDVRGGVDVAEGDGESDAIYRFHHHVGYQDVEMRGMGVAERFGSAERGHCGETAAVENHGESGGNDVVIVHDEDARKS